MLRLDVVATSHALARITTILTARRFEVLTMEVGAPVDGLRRVTVELEADNDFEVRRAVKFLQRSPDVVKIMPLADEKSHSRQAAFVAIDVPAARLHEVVTIAQAMSAEIVEVGQSRCILFLAADPRRVADLIRALGDFTARELVLSAPLRTRARVHRNGRKPAQS